LYLVNATLLLTHQIDAAFWKEWILFGIPGGIQGNLIFNMILIPILLFGFKQVVLEKKSAKTYSLILAGIGLFAAVIHSYFLIKGKPEFNLPLSVIVLALVFVVSIMQIIVSLKKSG